MTDYLQLHKSTNTETVNISALNAIAAYCDIVEQYSNFVEALQRNEPQNLSNLQNNIEHINNMFHENPLILAMTNIPYSVIFKRINKEVNPFIVMHGVNTMINSLKISHSLNIPNNQLIEIGLSSLLHTISLINTDSSLCLESRPFSNKNDPEATFQLIESAFEFIESQLSKENIISIIKMVNLGPELIAEDQKINEEHRQFAMIIHVCNVFNTLTHQNGYKEAKSSSDAMKIMRSEMKDYFHPEIIRLFFNELSIYPLGSYVKLSSKESAKIIEINKPFIMRPVVMIVRDETGKIKETPIKINLRDKPTIYIKESIIDQELAEMFIELF